MQHNESTTATLAELMVLGANSSFDPSKVATTTLQSILSHIRTLKRNNIDLDEQSLTINTVRMLDGLRDAKGKPLTDQYKRQIGMTIKRLFPKADIPLDKYKQAHNDSRTGRTTTRVSSDDFMNSVRKVRDAALAIISDVYLQGRIDDLGQYEACIATLLTLSTSLRIEEVRHLKLFHIVKIRQNEAIAVKSKSKYSSRIIANNNLLEATFTAIETQRKYVRDNVTIRKSDYASQYHFMRFNNDFIILSSADYMRKKLHEIAAAAGAKFDNSLGFTVFRKLTTSVLIEGGGFLTAQTMNNHSSLNTTLDHYNVMTSQSVQNTYNNLAENILNTIEKPNAERGRQTFENQLNNITNSSTSSKPAASIINTAATTMSNMNNNINIGGGANINSSTTTTTATATSTNQHYNNNENNNNNDDDDEDNKPSTSKGIFKPIQSRASNDYKIPLPPKPKITSLQPVRISLSQTQHENQPLLQQQPPLPPQPQQIQQQPQQIIQQQPQEIIQQEQQQQQQINQQRPQPQQQRQRSLTIEEQLKLPQSYKVYPDVRKEQHNNTDYRTLNEILKLKGDINALKIIQQTNEENLQAQINQLPDKLANQIIRFRNEVLRKLEHDYAVAIERSTQNTREFENLRNLMQRNLQDLSSYGIDYETLKAVQNEFEQKLVSLEKNNLTMQQLKQEYDQRLAKLEMLTAQLPKAVTVAKFQQLEKRLDATIQNDIVRRSEELQQEIARLNHNVMNVKKLFGIVENTEHQISLLQQLNAQNTIRQKENTMKMKNVLKELYQLKRYIVEHTIETNQAKQQKKQPTPLPPQPSSSGAAATAIAVPPQQQQTEPSQQQTQQQTQQPQQETQQQTQQPQQEIQPLKTPTSTTPSKDNQQNVDDPQLPSTSTSSSATAMVKTTDQIIKSQAPNQIKDEPMDTLPPPSPSPSSSVTATMQIKDEPMDTLPSTSRLSVKRNLKLQSADTNDVTSEKKKHQEKQKERRQQQSSDKVNPKQMQIFKQTSTKQTDVTMQNVQSDVKMKRRTFDDSDDQVEIQIKSEPKFPTESKTLRVGFKKSRLNLPFETPPYTPHTNDRYNMESNESDYSDDL